MIFALDTNIVIHYLRNNQVVHQNFIKAIAEGDNIVIPIIVNYEIQRGFRIHHAPKKEAVYNVLINPQASAALQIWMTNVGRMQSSYTKTYIARN
jgi:predicted nucleic acid-binding protein